MEKLFKKIKKDLELYSRSVVIEIVKEEILDVEYIKIEDSFPIYLSYKLIKNCSITVYNNNGTNIVQIYKM